MRIFAIISATWLLLSFPCSVEPHNLRKSAGDNNERQNRALQKSFSFSAADTFFIADIKLEADEGSDVCIADNIDLIRIILSDGFDEAVALTELGARIDVTSTTTECENGEGGNGRVRRELLLLVVDIFRTGGTCHFCRKDNADGGMVNVDVGNTQSSSLEVSTSSSSTSSSSQGTLDGASADMSAHLTSLIQLAGIECLEHKNPRVRVEIEEEPQETDTDVCA